MSEALTANTENQRKTKPFDDLSDENLLNIVAQGIDMTASASAGEELRRRWQEKALNPSKIRDLVEAFDGDYGFQHALVVIYQIQRGLLTYEEVIHYLKNERENGRKKVHSNRKRSKDEMKEAKNVQEMPIEELEALAENDYEIASQIIARTELERRSRENK